MSKKNNFPQQLRIIAGKWRHRKISFYADAGARPTLDQVRETLFNWLQNDIGGANCLDLFAGSGALGIEALSRGAKNVCFIDHQSQSIQHIQSSVNKLLGTEEKKITSIATYNNLNLPRGLSSLLTTAVIDNKFDIIFIDPPYHTNLLNEVLEAILKLGLLASGGVVYFEAGKQDNIDFTSWSILKHKQTKSLQYGLLGFSK